MPLSPEERQHRIQQYATGPSRLRAALAAVPPEATQWRPAAGEFSVHEIAVHCADSETNAAARIRYLMAGGDPVIIGYDPDTWAARFDYHGHPLELALATVEVVRANAVPVIRRLTGADWDRAGTHTESGRYTGHDWLQAYSDHLEEHIDQIKRTLAAWRERAGAAAGS